MKFLYIYFLILFFSFQAFSTARSTEKQWKDSSYVIVNEIIIGGNKKTKENVVHRELLFKTGDTIYNTELETIINKTKENLLNTSLFNYVYINLVNENQPFVTIYIIVEERWYLWPYVIFEQADRNLSSFFHEKDWSRINYGLMLVKNNFRGKRETLKLKVRLGYKEQFQLSYDIPFFLNTKNHGLSTEANFFRQKSAQYKTQFDKPVNFRDFSQYILEQKNLNLTYYYRNKFYTVNKLSLSLSNASIADTIAQLNPEFFRQSETSIHYLTLTYIFEHDKRNYKYYPLTGYNIDLMLSRKGLHILHNEMPGIWEFQTSAYTYYNFYKRWYTGTGGKIKLSSAKNQPYYIEQALGYGEFLRSFEYNLIDGQSFVTSRAFLKYELVPTRVKVIQAWHWSKFNKIHYSVYGNIFFDQGYVYDISPDPTNKLPNTYLYSFGMGIDLVTYYDQILRFEYSINPKGFHGFFIHLGKAF